MHHSILINPKQIFEGTALGVSGAADCSAVSTAIDFSQSSGYYLLQAIVTGPGLITLTALHSLDDANWAEVSGVAAMASSITSGVTLKKGDFGIAYHVKVKAKNTDTSAITSFDGWIGTK